MGVLHRRRNYAAESQRFRVYPGRASQTPCCGRARAVAIQISGRAIKAPTPTKIAALIQAPLTSDEVIRRNMPHTSSARELGGESRRVNPSILGDTIMNRLLAALALACALALGACQTSPGSSAGWGQIASGVGLVVGETKIDPQIEKVSGRLAGYCTEIQAAALAVDLFAPEKLQRAARDARLAVATFCASPPRSVATALASLAGAYAAIEAARRS